MAVCDPNWRTIIALTRFGGLRCPSEVLSLKWSHINWGTRRFSVPSPKTEHHPDGNSRDIPIFPDLAPYLQSVRELAETGADYVISGNYREAAMTDKGWANANQTARFSPDLAAVVEAWPKLPDAIRAGILAMVRAAE